MRLGALVFTVKSFDQQHYSIRNEISSRYMQELGRPHLLAIDSHQIHDSHPMAQPVE